MTDTEILRAQIDCLESMISVLKDHDSLLLPIEPEYHPDLTEAAQSLQRAKDVYIKVTGDNPWS